ncbi:ankyrin repeat domain-containing protein [Pseudoduganella violaceinigra]|uniref:ankyrin repeat domain-containing protein n=1 Tax=Pseudoduganella violaceinigra TaxID=246602 RepID=UPI00041327A6|nr:ankyrin repeat domain-containing protein [Pseudoduganella violaceinigra]
MTPARRALLAAGAAALLARAAWAGEDIPSAEEDAGNFFRVIQLDDERAVKAMLARGLDPNLRDPVRGETGLIVAMRYEAMKIARLLLAQPAIQPDLQAPNGNTALMMAAFKKNKPAVLLLLEKGAQVNRPGWTALHYAAAAGDLDIMKLLLERGAHVDAESPTGATPLMLAAQEGQEDAVSLLLDRGADATRKDRAWHQNAAGFAQRVDKPWIAERIRRHLNGK